MGRVLAKVYPTLTAFNFENGVLLSLHNTPSPLQKIIRTIKMVNIKIFVEQREQSIQGVLDPKRSITMNSRLRLLTLLSRFR
jgi:hypothetical protein